VLRRVGVETQTVDTTRRSLSRRGRLVEAGCVGGGAVVGSIAFTWPLILHVQTLARDRFDALFQAWTINWIQYAADHAINIYNAPMFVPEHTTLAYSDTLAGVAVPLLPLHWLGMSPLGVLNVAVLLGFAPADAERLQRVLATVLRPPVAGAVDVAESTGIGAPASTRDPFRRCARHGRGHALGGAAITAGRRAAALPRQLRR